ncbi:hypothetical protein PGT21_001212 [Puccinia graminis f. sp. tritici]|uniref:Uncharacterized protein n=1 Tax=Puccinia graminis f. sp. tritici TaxID=56615 RepID=A0A5B0P8P7_PUCGR|nr:hypothetical protein PGT21_000949 [Puccinia graminis f. sp. tritici]KAA1097000.1 hypothetical protein PGTUg99_001899 [Puccinia graminis f. sp. tritici]KAA1099273.1 hypothetical protein PGT21_001212 [Puccinia graminis f. sp. tritici]KAA1122631.1 hypothetical protein PGTUg99_003577 [Puccinia graminis f. sp. tritici]
MVNLSYIPPLTQYYNLDHMKRDKLILPDWPKLPGSSFLSSTAGLVSPQNYLVAATHMSTRSLASGSNVSSPGHSQEYLFSHEFQQLTPLAKPPYLATQTTTTHHSSTSCLQPQ